MDDLAHQPIILELAVPGIYAAVLKLVQGGEAVDLPPFDDYTMANRTGCYLRQ